ncbi:meiosis regulator and mRNA stability factor 1-like [Oppia nitens]|uniref:meiosis regulator and mRNA stability factor 1-like n=1 Tax=Oppia nitens TaxID=1686743 RepID=UPI0023DC3800|nr:meiosis regulator and mRNA stability factor 1-like [Oppia nitens]XP_054164643.1 meiosis regulator and mRNA stability factor 1-like [Oppia nitens]
MNAQEVNQSMIGCHSYGIFWDIENCGIPQLERAATVVQSVKTFIRSKFEGLVGEQPEPCVFYCSCDTRNLDPRHVEGLNRTGVDILHVNPVRVPPNKVDADTKLMECIQKFVDHHNNKCAVFVITGDIDFAPAIRSAKRRGFQVILLYGSNCSEDLRNCATEAHSFYDIISSREKEIRLNNTRVIRDTLPTILPHLANGPNVATTSNRLVNVSLATNETINTDVSQKESNISPKRQIRQQINDSTDKLVEFDPKKLSTVLEVTGVERHIALRVLEICNGDVEMTINTIISD